jgi:hypothetical protein
MRSFRDRIQTVTDASRGAYVGRTNPKKKE